MADGAVYDENGNVKHIHDRKLEALEDLIEAANGKPVLIAYCTPPILAFTASTSADCPQSFFSSAAITLSSSVPLAIRWWITTVSSCPCRHNPSPQAGSIGGFD